MRPAACTALWPLWSATAATIDGRADLLVVPCVSPWAYEHVQRWNAAAIDPNRNFREGSPAEESAALVALIAPIKTRVALHIDLHETTDSDESEFRPAVAARDGKAFEPGEIPDGFYTVGDTPNPQLEFQTAVINAVAQVTHIAPPDATGQIIGSDVVAPGVILYPFKELGLCAGLTDAPYTTTTEVYPDSPRATPEQCVDAQVGRRAGGHRLRTGAGGMKAQAAALGLSLTMLLTGGLRLAAGLPRLGR